MSARLTAQLPTLSPTACKLLLYLLCTPRPPAGTRALARAAGLSRATLLAALRELAARELLRVRPGRGRRPASYQLADQAPDRAVADQDLDRAAEAVQVPGRDAEAVQVPGHDPLASRAPGRALAVRAPGRGTQADQTPGRAATAAGGAGSSAAGTAGHDGALRPAAPAASPVSLSSTGETGPETGEAVWARARARLREWVAPLYDTAWFATARLELRGTTAVLHAPDRQTAEWLRRSERLIHRALVACAVRPRQYAYVVA